MIDGPINTVPGVDTVGLLAWLDEVDGTFTGTDTIFRVDLALSCVNNRPYLNRFNILNFGGGTAFGLSQTPIFKWDVPFNEGVFIDTPKVLSNENASVVCSPTGINSPLCRNGTVTVQAIYDLTCNQNAPNMLLASKCGDPSQTIIVDPNTSTGEERFQFNGEIYEITGRTNGTPVSGAWVNTPCPQALVAPGQGSKLKQGRANAGQLPGFRKRGLVSESELDAMGADPEQEARALKQGGCCDAPRE
jgi:hypothetical protein